ncbi:histidine kinase [Mariniphaga sp.]|uniref:histidine kinase n=1 Tax=Mariniphaga sp. TaxID=1954475 RepID=UPI003562B233
MKVNFPGMQSIVRGSFLNKYSLKSLLLLIISVWLPVTVSAFNLAQKPDSGFLIHEGVTSAKVFITKNNTLDIHQVSAPEFRPSFTEIPRRYLTSGNEIYWFLIDFGDTDLAVSDLWFVRFGYYDDITLYFPQNDTLAFRKAGVMNKDRSAGVKDITYIPFRPGELIEDRFIFVKVRQITRKNSLVVPTYRNSETVDFISDYVSRFFFNTQMPYFFFIGGMLLMFFYFIGFYFMYNDRLYVWYSLYLFSLILFIGTRTYYIWQFLQSTFPVFGYLFYETIQVGINISYLIFARIFMNAKIDFPKLNKAIHYALILLVTVVLIQITVITVNPLNNYERHIMNFQRYFMIVFSLAAYVYILKKYRNKLVLFLVGGSFFYLTGAVLSMVLWNIRYIMIGTAVEVFIFSIGMGYRIKIVEQTRQSIENEMNKLRLTALRAQMNPHFIFNSLNSIRAYIISSETKKASDYLNKFARLIRLILHYSSKDFISLKEELEALALYVELEQMRFREDFGFALKVASDVDKDNWQVPPLILQPYVENAIVHGLAPKTGVKELLVKVSKSNSNLCFVIRDNGVGRSYSKNIRSIQNPQHKSVAMELTRKRIELTAEKQTENENIKILDLTKDGHPTGTEVKIKLPVHTDEKPN